MLQRIKGDKSAPTGFHLIIPLNSAISCSSVQGSNSSGGSGGGRGVDVAPERALCLAEILSPLPADGGGGGATAADGVAAADGASTADGVEAPREEMRAFFLGGIARGSKRGSGERMNWLGCAIVMMMMML